MVKGDRTHSPCRGRGDGGAVGGGHADRDPVRVERVGVAVLLLLHPVVAAAVGGGGGGGRHLSEAEEGVRDSERRLSAVHPRLA